MSDSEPKTLEEPSQPLDRPIDGKSPGEEDQRPREDSNPPEKLAGEEEDEEEGECGFCLFMKGGGCRESFVAWEKCIEEAEKSGEDIVEKCFEITGALKKCMEAHADYYEPVLRAEKAAEAEAIKELEKEAAAAEAEKQKDSEPKEASSSGDK